MGIYLNPGNQNFVGFVKTGKYVDKTMLLDVTNGFMDDPTSKFICVSRPRRFGKSIAEDMLAAYYSKGADSRQLFSQFKIAGAESFGKYLNVYNVVYIDLNSIYAKWQEIPEENRPKLVVHLLNALVCRDFKGDFTDCYTLADCILRVYFQKGETFIIIIDEYDVLLREQVDEKELEIYRAFLNSLFKSSEIKPAISLAYLTGILPIMKDRVQSKLNTF